MVLYIPPPILFSFQHLLGTWRSNYIIMSHPFSSSDWFGGNCGTGRKELQVCVQVQQYIQQRGGSGEGQRSPSLPRGASEGLLLTVIHFRSHRALALKRVRKWRIFALSVWTGQKSVLQM